MEFSHSRNSLTVIPFSFCIGIGILVVVFSVPPKDSIDLPFYYPVIILYLSIAVKRLAKIEGAIVEYGPLGRRKLW